jgi:hypothetical protein
MDISEIDRGVIGQIVSVVKQAQEGNAEAVLRPYVDSVISRCAEMTQGNPAVLAFVADVLDNANRWALGDWSDGTVAQIADSVWSSLAVGLRQIPGASEALASKDQT